MLAALDRPGAFWRRTDQTFLQSFFPDWHGLPVTCNMLQYVWFNLPALWHWPQVRIVHYQYEKPWVEHAKADRLRPLIGLWRAYAGDGPVPDTDSLADPSP
jgi:alpha-N-acetylglucosamine transferase